jgi:hypothetical protein
MRRFFLLVPALLLTFSGCTTPQHEDSWRYDAAAATAAYGEGYLKEDPVMVQSEAIDAKRSARQSGDLVPLARFYLSQCALHHAVLIGDDCTDYLEVAAAAPSEEHDAYYAMLTKSLKKSQVSDLPYRYREFARAWLAQDVRWIRGAITTLEPLQSKMVAASVAREQIDETVIEAIIDGASHLGYRRAVIAWMRYLQEVTANPAKKERLQKKLDLLEKER